MKRTTLILALALAACGGSDTSLDPGPSPTTAPPTAGAETASAPSNGRLPGDVRPTRYTLMLAVDPNRDRFTGVVEIDIQLPRRTTRIYLHGQELEVAEVTVTESGRDARDAAWEAVDAEEGLARVTVSHPVGPGSVRLRVTYGAAFNANLMGFYRVQVGDQFYVYSQMEPLGARLAFPCFDEPSFKTPYDVTMVVREDHAAIANAREISGESTTGGMRRVRFATTESLPTYLMAIAVGPFDIVEADPIPANDVRSAPLALRGVAPRGQGAQLAHALRHTPAILAQLESFFGIGYPFDKLDVIAVPDFGAGAMENAGAVTFRDSLLLVPTEGASIGQQRAFAFVMAHELAHMWVGNLVTMQWWDDLWLNEAFASWMEWTTIEATFPEFEPRTLQQAEAFEAMGSDSLASARRIRQPITSTHDISNAFDSITYTKGSAVISMFERWLTPEVFRRGVQAYLRAHREGSATAEDLFAALSEASGRDVSAPFSTFVTQPGVPLVDVTPRCEGEQGSLALRQSRYLPLGSSASPDARWQIPFCARYRAGGEVRSTCTLLTETEGTLALEGGCADWVMPNAGGVGYYRWTLPAEALATLRSRGLSALDIRETLSFADSIEAGFRAGRITFEDAMGALGPFARRPERTLATAPMGLAELAIEHYLDDDTSRDRARRWAARLYRDPLRRLGWTPAPNETPETQIYREHLLTFLAMIVEDRAVRNDAADRGRAYLGLRGDEQIHPDAVAADLAPLAVAVAVQQGGERVFEHALARLRESTDPVVRGVLLRGISRTRDDALRARLFALTIDEHSGLRQNEVYPPFMEQMGEAEGRAALFAFVRESYDPLVARIGPHMAGYLPYVGAEFCTAERAVEVQELFAPRVAATQGGPRNLESAVESVSLCAALRDHSRQSAAAFFAR